MDHIANMQNINHFCRPEFETYRTELYVNYAFSVPSADGTETELIDLRKYEFPLSEESIQAIADRNSVTVEAVKKASVNIAKGVVRDYKITEYLKSEGIRSVVQYHTYQPVAKENGSDVYMTTPCLIPLSEIWQHQNITMGFVIDLGRRLFAICTDLERVGVTHRNISPYNIFFTADTKRLVLGGFECAAFASETKPPNNPFVYACHQAPAIQNGERGDLTTDAYSIASIMGCFFEGTVLTKEFRDAIPEVVPVHIREAITLGRSLNRDNLIQFRKLLNKLYKEAKGLYWETPICSMYQKQLGQGASASPIMKNASEDVSGSESEALKKAIARVQEKVKTAIRKKIHKESMPPEETATVRAIIENSTAAVAGPAPKKKGSTLGIVLSAAAGMFVMCLILLVIGYLTGYIALT